MLTGRLCANLSLKTSEYRRLPGNNRWCPFRPERLTFIYGQSHWVEFLVSTKEYKWMTMRICWVIAGNGQSGHILS